MATNDPLRAPRSVLASPGVEHLARGRAALHHVAEAELLRRIRELIADVPEGTPLVLLLARYDTAPSRELQEVREPRELLDAIDSLKVGEALRIVKAANVTTEITEPRPPRWYVRRELEVVTEAPRVLGHDMIAVSREVLEELHAGVWGVLPGESHAPSDVVAERRRNAKALLDKLIRALDLEAGA